MLYHEGSSAVAREPSLPRDAGVREVSSPWIRDGPETYLRAFLDEVSPSAADRLAARAAALEAGQPAEAERLYRQALGQESNHEGVRVGLARVLLSQGKTDEVADLLEPVGSEGEVG